VEKGVRGRSLAYPSKMDGTSIKAQRACKSLKEADSDPELGKRGNQGRGGEIAGGKKDISQNKKKKGGINEIIRSHVVARAQVTDGQFET